MDRREWTHRRRMEYTELIDRYCNASVPHQWILGYAEHSLVLARLQATLTCEQACMVILLKMADGAETAGITHVDESD